MAGSHFPPIPTLTEEDETDDRNSSQAESSKIFDLDAFMDQRTIAQTASEELQRPSQTSSNEKAFSRGHDVATRPCVSNVTKRVTPRFSSATKPRLYTKRNQQQRATTQQQQAPSISYDDTEPSSNYPIKVIEAKEISAVSKITTSQQTITSESNPMPYGRQSQKRCVIM